MKIFLVAILALGLLVMMLWPRHAVTLTQPESITPSLAASESNKIAISRPIEKQTVPELAGLRKRLTEFSEEERQKFEADFRSRLKPAIVKWAEAFDGHLPFSADDVTPDNLAERIGRDDRFREHVFVVNGITLGLRDANGDAAVDYLNNPIETKKLAVLPNNQGPPKIDRPISREKLIEMLAADSGNRFQLHEVRIKPSGFSGSLNGGSLVQVGGNPGNSATWKYDMVIGADGRLAFYLRTF